MSSLTTYFPLTANIQSISKANPAVVTTTANHAYNNDLFVRIVIPYPGSMQQINNKIFKITVISPTTFSLPVDSSGFDTFIADPLNNFSPIIPAVQIAQAIPVAESNSTLINAVNNIGPRNP